MIQRRTLAPLAASLLAWPALTRAQGAQGASAAHSPPSPASLFFQNAQFGSAKMSPDGTRVAFLVTGPDGNLRLAVLDLATMKSTVAVAIKDADVYYFDWVNDQRLIFTQDTEYRGEGLFSVNHDGSKYTVLKNPLFVYRASADPDRERALLPWGSRLIHINTSRKGDHVYVVTPRQQNKVQGVGLYVLRRVNTLTSFVEVLDSPLHAQQWFMDRDDVLRAVVTRQGERGSFDLLQPDGSFKSLYTYNARDPGSTSPSPVYWAPDGTVYALAPALGDKDGIYTYDVNKAQLAAQPLLASKDFDLSPSFVVNDERVLGVRYTVDAEVTLWLDPQLKAHQATIDEMLPATTNRVSVAKRPTQPYLLVQAYSDTQPELSYLFNTQTRKLVRLGATRPDVKPAQMGLMDLVRIKARDGLEIPAWLTLPRGAEKLDKKNLPLVVLVHGGPWSRGNQWRWEPEAQFLASRGYAVLQPEFRGSTGYGAKHFKAGWNQWGLAMQSDLADAARWAVAQGIADPKRMAIMGGSYGGYAAMMGLVTDPDLYRCAINYLGVTDLDMMFSVSWSDVSDEAKRYGYGTLIGDPVADAARFKATSPLQQAARIKQPVLMAYGEWDDRVPLVHGEKMRDALKRHNPNVEWVVYEKEGHGWSRVETRLDFWGRVERFLAKNLAVAP